MGNLGNKYAKTFKSDIVIDYINRLPKGSTMALARLIHEENKLYFDNFEQARAMVRGYRGEMKKNQTQKTVIQTRTEEEKKNFIRKKLPESDYEKCEPFIIPKGQNNILILSDIHLPYQDNKALELAINYGIEHKVNAVYLNGDTLDFYMASRFLKNPKLRDLAGELEMGREFLKLLQDTFKCPIYFKIGNHEVNGNIS